jgi:hypothetical protein
VFSTAPQFIPAANRKAKVQGTYPMMDMDEENEDIAAAMGFSSFGGSKKRKFDQASSPNTTKDSASGANSTHLGVRPKNAQQHVPEDGAHVASTNNSTPKPSKPAATGLAEFLARAKTLPDKPPQAEEHYNAASQNNISVTEAVSFGGEPITRAELNALRFGVPGENGDTAYFLPSFVEDPWANLKRDR